MHLEKTTLWIVLFSDIRGYFGTAVIPYNIVYSKNNIRLGNTMNKLLFGLLMRIWFDKNLIL